jgi:preprotein translocase SecE subunit
MDEVKRYVNIAYIIAAIVMSWFYMNFAAWLMGVVSLGDTRLLGEHVTISTIVGFVLGALTAVLLWRNSKVYEGALNVAREMKKVTWPNGDETKHAMLVVIITAALVAFILFCFDFAAKTLTDLILGIK